MRWTAILARLRVFSRFLGRSVYSMICGVELTWPQTPTRSEGERFLTILEDIWDWLRMWWPMKMGSRGLTSGLSIWKYERISLPLARSWG